MANFDPETIETVEAVTEYQPMENLRITAAAFYYWLSIPLRSMTICWKFKSASSRPWLTSAW